MDDLKPLAVFAEVVDAGSMSAAARRLGMSPSAVSQTIRALEQHGGVTLLHRSTRKLALYRGRRALLPALPAHAGGRACRGAVAEHARDAPSGELRVAAPVGFAIHVAPALAPLLAEAPQLRLRLLVDDAMIDLIDARIDVAIRIGRMADSSWIARRLCDFDMILCASPDYLARGGIPHDAAALAGAPLARLRPRDAGTVPRDSLAGARQRARSGRAGRAAWARARSPTSQPASMAAGHARPRRRTPRACACRRASRATTRSRCSRCASTAWASPHLGHLDVSPVLARGELVRLLPQWRFGSMPVWAVTPRRDEAEAAKVRPRGRRPEALLRGLAGDGPTRPEPLPPRPHRGCAFAATCTPNSTQHHATNTHSMKAGMQASAPYADSDTEWLKYSAQPCHDPHAAMPAASAPNALARQLRA